MNPDIFDLQVRSSKEAGSCNVCRKYISSKGSVEHQVWCLYVLRSEHWFCDECFKSFIFHAIPELQRALNEGQKQFRSGK